MPMNRNARALLVLAPAAISVFLLSGCGGGGPPEKNVKPATKLDPEVEEKLKAMNKEAAAHPLPTPEEVEAANKKAAKGARRKGGASKKR